VVLPAAHRDLQRIRDHIAQDSPKEADRWLRTLWRKAKSLSTLPLRCEVIPEADELGGQYRHLLVGNYRIIYTVEGNQVIVVRFMNAAMMLTPERLPRRTS
jgi:plasmid stabilization system protein ParE